MNFQISVAGLLVGILVGLTGMGGGALLAPIMILLFRVPPIWAVGTDIAYATVTKAVGSLVHIRQKDVNFKIALLLACGSVPATLLSTVLVQYIHKHYASLINGLILHTLGVVLLLVAVLLVIKPFVLRQLEHHSKSKYASLTPAGEGKSRWQRVGRPAATVAVGAGVGFLVGLTSVGSGTLIVVSLAFMFPQMGSKELVGTDIFQAFLLLMAGVIGYLNAGTINWGMVLLLLLGSLPGVYIGSKISKYMPDRYMRPLLATVLAISGFKLI